MDPEAEVEVMGQDKVPYTPDLIFGYKGRKVYLFLTNARFIETSSLGEPLDGHEALRYKTIEMQQPSVKCLTVPIEALLDLDLEQPWAQYNENFDMQEILNRVVGQDHIINTRPLEEMAADMSGIDGGEHFRADLL